MDPLPDEQRSYRRHFLALSALLLAATAWAVADEVWVRRPWKAWQVEYLALSGADEAPAVRQLVLPDTGAVERCVTCHAGVDDPAMDDPELPLALRAHPEREALLGAHPPERFGCTSCHRGQGPALTAGSAHGDEDPDWPEPLLRGDAVQASCRTCHQGEQAPAGAPALALGQRLFEEKGCGGCHAVDERPPRKRGPSLARVGAKLEPGAMLSWIREAGSRRAGSEMPQFWPGAEGDPEAARQRDEESLAIAAYLIDSSADFPEGGAPDRADPALADEGRELFDRVGCRGCHVLGSPGADELEIGGGDDGGASDAWAAFGGDDLFGGEPEPEHPPIDFGPALADAGARSRFPFLVGWLLDPSSYWSGAHMPSLRLTEREALALASYLEGIAPAAPEVPAALAGAPDPDLVERGRALVAGYGCYGCHEIPGFEQASWPGPDLSTYGEKGTREMFFGEVEPPARDWESYTAIKLRDPRAYATEEIEQRMPRFDLSEEEIRGLSVYLRSLTGRRAPEGLTAAGGDAQLALAERILRERNCQGCHTMDGRDGDIGRYYADVNLGPPPLTHEGARVQPGWLFNFLARPTALRPWLDLRMPDFSLSDEESAALVAWFAERSQVPAPLRRVSTPPVSAARAEQASALFEELKCVTCHQLAIGDGVDAADLAPDLGRARQRLDPEWIRAFLHDPAELLPGTRMPQFFAGGQSPVPEILDGDAEAQIDLIVDHLMNLGLQPVDGQPEESGA